MSTDPKLRPLSSFVDHPDELAEHTMSSVEWEAVEVLMPRILRGKSKEDVKQMLLAEIDGMSKKRLLAVLAGEVLDESSSSEEEEEEVENNSEAGEQSAEPPGEERMEVQEEVKNVDDMEDGELETTPPPNPGSPREEVANNSEELDTDEEIDRQLEKDLEDFLG